MNCKRHQKGNNRFNFCHGLWGMGCIILNFLIKFQRDNLVFKVNLQFLRELNSIFHKKRLIKMYFYVKSNDYRKKCIICKKTIYISWFLVTKKFICNNLIS